MLPSKHINCQAVWHMILMWDEARNIYMWCPNEKWKDVDWSKPSLWTMGEAYREWQRITRSLSKYGDHEFRMIRLHSCGDHDILIQMKIDRHGD